MEFNINILDSFPSLNKIPQKNNLFLEFNNKEYFLNKLIFQQEIITSKKSLSKFYFKIYLMHNSKKILIGANNITQDSIKFDNNKSFITWIEFRKRNQESNKEISDLNILFFDCIRLKIKITLIRKVPKTDKRIKTTKSKIKVGAKTPIIPKKEELKYSDKNDIIEMNNTEDNNLNSYRFIENNYLLKSKSQEESEKVNNNEELENKKVNSNNITEKYNNLQFKSEDSISHEAKNLLIDNDCILTDNNLFENYSYSTSLGDNNNKNVFKYKSEFDNKIINDNKNDNINSAFTQKNSLMALDNCKYLNKQEKNNADTNDSFDDNKNKKIKIMKSKFKSMNKLIKANKNNKQNKFKNMKNNLMNKSNTNNTLPLIKEQVFFNSNTYNNFYKKKEINDENNNNYIETNINNDNTKNVFLNNLLISHDNEINEINNYEVIKVEKTINQIEEFISMKKDYDLLYTPVFIKEIKKDLLDLEFNIALEKSFSLFLSYNDQTYLFFKQKKDLSNRIKNCANKIKILNKKQNLLKTIKTKNELKEKNKLILNEFDNINLKRNYIAQKNIFENLINGKINQKIMLKSIISILLKKKPDILENIKQTKKPEKENINSNEIFNNNKYIIKSPSRNKNKSKIKSPQVGKQKQQFEFMSEIKNKNSLFNNKLMNKKKSLNKNLRKNRSINYLVSVENNNDKNKNKESKATLAKDNLIYYSTAKNKFYPSKIEKGK